MSARGIREAEVWRTEQIQHYARTSDPSFPSVGDEWVRTDIQPVTNSVAELRIQGPGGILKAPVFDPSVSLGSDVYVGRRYVFADGSEGLLLATDQGGAVGSPRIVTSSGTELEAHDDVEVSAIPDSVTSHWQYDEGSGTTAAADSEGTVDITLSADDWTTDTRFQGGEGYTLDKEDNRWETNATLGVNNQEFSIAFWIWDYGGASAGATPFAWTSGGSIPDDGWVIEDLDGNLEVRFRSGGSNGFIAENLNLTTDGSTSYYIGLSGDGDAGNVYVWDSTQQVHTASGSGTRGGVGTNTLLSGGGRTDAPRYLGGVQDAQYVSTTAAWTESEFEIIWNETKP